MLLPKRSTTTKHPTSLTQEQLKFYGWITQAARKLPWTPEELNTFTEAYELTEKELAYYVSIDRRLRQPLHWQILQLIYKDNSNCNSDNIIDDSLDFISAFSLDDTYSGRFSRSKLYSLYYSWSELPMSREKFFSIFTRKYYPIPKESALISAFIINKKTATTERKQLAAKRRAELAEIVYGKKEKVKATLWNFW